MKTSRLLILLSCALLLTSQGVLAAKKPKPVVFAGEIKNAEGKTVAGAKVTLTAPDGTLVGELVTDKRGKFEIKSPAGPGTYRFRVEAAGSAPYDDKVDLEGDGQNLAITLMSAEMGRKNEAIALYNAGVDAFRNKDTTAAKAKFEAALTTDPTMAAPWLGLADIYLNAEENNSKAIEMAEKFMELSPGDEQGKRFLYAAYVRAGQRDKAKVISDELGDAKLQAGLAIDVFNQGAMASQKGDYKLAEAKFREAIELDPNLAEAHAALASALYVQLKFQEALASADQALALKPGIASGLRQRFLALDGLGKGEESGVAWEAYSKVDAKAALDLLSKRAETDFTDGNVDKAVAALNKVLGIDPNFADAHLRLGLVFSGTDVAKAKTHLKRFLELAPQHPEASTARDILEYLK
jgi:tetratricopeptide (TPR) repeat protein